MTLRWRWLLFCLAACTRTATIGTIAEAEPDAAIADAVPDATVDATVEQVALVDECVSGVNSAVPVGTVEVLRAGGESDSSVRWLYPYYGTVFPGGVGAPALMWEGLDADAVYVRIRARSFAYDGCLFPESPNTLPLSDAIWRRAEQASTGADDPLLVTLTMAAKGRVVTLPVRELVIAPGTLRGSLYYQSYGSRVQPTSASAAVLQLRMGETAVASVAPIGCAGCHGVASRGTRMLAYVTGQYTGYRLSATNPPVALPVAPPVAEYAALSPDGAWYVAPARPTALGPRFYGAGGTIDAALYATDTGIAQPSGGIAPGAMMPAFSPEGDALTFTDANVADGKGVAMMRFANASASDYRVLYQDSTRFPGWPTFLPAQRGVVFALGERNDYSGGGVRVVLRAGTGPRSDLYALELTDQSAAMLHRAMGFSSVEDAENERSYLPFGAEDLHQNYNPNSAPVLVGGYYWVFFDSIRHYGNLGSRRLIWCAAVDAGSDRPFDPSASHPAFYVRGQDLDGTNMRPIFALD